MCSCSQMDQSLRSLLSSGRNILITGAGGVGKSYTTREIIDSLNAEGQSVLVCAYTGVAALNIGGTTLHSLLGQGLFSGPIDVLSGRMISMLRRKKLNDLASRWIKCDTLIIDEISMMDVSLFIRASAVIGMFRKEAQRMGMISPSINTDSPWGGIQLVLVGDFLQLPPIEKYKDEEGVTYTYIFEHPIWKDMNIHILHLTESKRYDDDGYFDTLNDIRMGICSNRVRDLLTVCSRSPKVIRCTNDDTLYIRPTILYATNREVDSLNESELDRLDTKEVTYDMSFTCTSVKIPASITMDDMTKHMPIPVTSRFRIGCQVMLMRNMLDMGLCNGSRGVVVRYADKGLPVVEFDNGKVVTIEYTSRTLVRTFYDGSITETQVGTLEYIPLKLAYAMSIHKSQGQTCSSVLLSASTIFGPSMLYVALSRCKSRDRLYINGYSDIVFKRSTPNSSAILFYKKINDVNEAK